MQWLQFYRVNKLQTRKMTNYLSDRCDHGLVGTGFILSDKTSSKITQPCGEGNSWVKNTLQNINVQIFSNFRSWLKLCPLSPGCRVGLHTGKWEKETLEETNRKYQNGGFKTKLKLFCWTFLNYSFLLVDISII